MRKATFQTITSRRRLLQYVAASPLFAGSAMGAEGGPLEETDPMRWAPSSLVNLIKSPADALDVFDYEPVAFKNVPPAHFGYMATGAGDETTLRVNRSDFAKFSVMSRRLRKVDAVDTSVNLFGTKWKSPIFICPTGYNKAFHADGEIGVTKAAGARGSLQFLSASSGTSIEDAMKARDTPLSFQLYAPSDFELARSVVARVERAGAPVLAITVDGVSTRKLATMERLKRLDRRNCLECHDTPQGGSTTIQMANYSHIDRTVYKDLHIAMGALDWDFVRRLRDTTKMKVIIKGILDPDDALLCVKYGFDGIEVSNHGGRQDDAGISAIAALPGVVAAVKGRIPVLVDSGFRRGTDIVKALAMGATAVGIGRPYLWGLGAFGQAGVEGVLDLLQAELVAAMAQAGVASIAELSPKMVRKV